MKRIILLIFVVFINMANAQVGCWKVISAGDRHIIGIKNDGTLWAWGLNASGQLGDGTTVDKKVPTQIGTDNDWLTVATGASHTLAIKNNGTLWAWGFNTTGQLGDGTTVAKTSPVQIGVDNDWKQITAAGHSMALKADGSLWGWGYNGYGQLGDGTIAFKTAPVQIGTDYNWIKIVAGNYHTLAIKNDNTLWSWGYNNSGQLGDGTTTNRATPAQIGLNNDWKFIAARSSHSIALKYDGTIWAWGSNNSGEIGDGTTTAKNVPTQAGTDNDWQSIAAGYFHTIALKNNNTLWAWGSNTNGQLGDGTLAKKTSPIQIGTDVTWQTIQAGGNYSQGIKKNGSVWAWGMNTNGQVGDGTFFDKTSPVFIDCISNCNQTPINDTILITNCGFILYQGTMYNSSTTVIDTIRSTQNCDSVYKVALITVLHTNAISGRITHPTKGGINKAIVRISGTINREYEVSKTYMEDCNNTGSNIAIKLAKNNDIAKANGVNSVDALLVQRHVLNTTKLNNAYKLIAADVDGNKTINSVDVLRIKRLILGTDTTFKNTTTSENRLWAFVDSAYQFPDTTNPFPFKDSIAFTNLTSNKTNQTFIGVKLGDVNFDWNSAVAKPSLIDNVQLTIDKAYEKDKGAINCQFSIANSQLLSALQTTLHFDNTQYEFVSINNNMLDIDFNTTQANKTGNISLVWIDKQGETKTFKTGEELFTLILRKRSTVSGQQFTDWQLSDDITTTAAYDEALNKKGIVLIEKSTANSPLSTVSGQQWTIYPNPAHSQFTVVGESMTNKGQIIVTNILGKQVAAQALSMAVILLTLAI